MIHRISANKSSFRAVEFDTGFNIILADRQDDNSSNNDRRSCNGLGKTTLINIIDFCLGANHTDGSPCNLYHREIADWEFTLDITLGDSKISATRGFEESSRMYISGSTDKLKLSPNYFFIMSS